MRGGANSCFALLVVVSLYLLAQQQKESGYHAWDRTALIYSISMLSLVLATFLSQVYHLRFSTQPYDGASRFLFAIPVYLILRRGRLAKITILQYGFSLGAIASALVPRFDPRNWGENRLGSYFLNPIHFGDLALMLGFLALMTIDWEREDPFPVRSLKVVALFAGVYASIQSGSRGGWIAIPVLVYIWMHYRKKRNSLVNNSIIIALFLLAALASYLLIGEVHDRVDAVYQNITAFDQSHEDTSVGLRFQIWKAAILLFKQNPVFGLGPDQFKQMMIPLHQAGVISRMAADLGMGEVHNEILAHAVNLGIFGLASILSIYFVPLFIFVRSAKSDSHLKRTAAALGICLVSGFIIFGLTVETFDLKMTATFYSLTVAVLLAAATNRETPDAVVSETRGAGSKVEPHR